MSVTQLTGHSGANIIFSYFKLQNIVHFQSVSSKNNVAYLEAQLFIHFPLRVLKRF